MTNRAALASLEIACLAGRLCAGHKLPSAAKAEVKATTLRALLALNGKELDRPSPDDLHSAFDAVLNELHAAGANWQELASWFNQHGAVR